MAEKTSSIRGLLITFGVAALLAIGIIFARSHFREVVEVRTAKAMQAPLVSTVSTNGKVEPVEDYNPHATVAGIVKKVFVEVGAHVKRGQSLIKMDDSDATSRLAAAQASLVAAEANLKNMQQNGTQDERLGQQSDLTNALAQQKQAATTLTATQALQARGSASANEVAVAQQRLSDAQTRVSQLKARSSSRFSSLDLSSQQSQVAQARAALLAARSAYGGVDLRAPFDGTVYSVPVSDLDFVQFGEALLNMANLNHIQVRAYFDEPEIGKLTAGQPVKIVWDAKPYSTWHGHIERAPSTIITYGTRNVGECIISVDDAKGDLLPNTNVTVSVTVSQLADVLSVPREALRTEGPKNYVYRIVDGHLKEVPLQVGASNLTRIQITGGLNEGDVVALSAVSNSELKDGQEVKALR